jgi:Amt family ammonium transporter
MIFFLIHEFFFLANFLLRGVGLKPALPTHTIPASAFMIFQAMFACLTPGIIPFSAEEKDIELITQFFFLFSSRFWIGG